MTTTEAQDGTATAAIEAQLSPEEQEVDRQITAFVEGFAARFIEIPPLAGETIPVKKKLVIPNQKDSSQKIEIEQIRIEQTRMLNGGLRTSVTARLNMFYGDQMHTAWINGDTPHVNPELDNVVPLPYPPSSPVVRPAFSYLSTFAELEEQYGAKGFALLQHDVQAGFFNGFRFGSDVTETLANAVKPPTSS